MPFLYSNIDNLRKYAEVLKNILWKYHILFLTIFCFAVNPNGTKLIFSIFEAPTFSCVLTNAVSLVFTVLSIVLLNKTLLNIEEDRYSYVLYFVVLFFIYRTGGQFEDLSTSIGMIVLAVSAYICFVKPVYVYLIPLLGMIANVYTTQFINQFLISILVIYLILNYQKNNVSDKTNKNTFILTGVCSLIGPLIDYIKTPDKLDYSSMSWQYYNDYMHFGLTPRGIIATLFSLITIGQRSALTTSIYIVLMHALSYIVIVLLLYVLYKKAADKKQDLLPIFACILVSEPFRNILSMNMYIYYDCVLVMLTMLCLTLIICDRFVFLTPIVIAVCMLIHHGYAIFFYPLIFAVLCYKYVHAEKNDRRKLAILILANCFIVVLLFAYFHFVSHKYIKISYPEACNYLGGCLGKDIPSDLFDLSPKDVVEEYGYFFPNINYVIYDGKTTSYGIQVISISCILATLVVFVTMVPLFLFVKKKYLSDVLSQIDKCIAYCGLFSLFIFAVAYLEADYGRWISFYMLNLLLCLLTISIDKSSKLPENDDLTTNNKFYKFLLVLMMAMPNLGVWGLY